MRVRSLGIGIPLRVGRVHLAPSAESNLTVETDSCCHQHVSVCNRLKLLSVSVPHLLVGKSEHGRKVGAR
jgi:hypothetical protein